jgi:hypothetical protein
MVISEIYKLMKRVIKQRPMLKYHRQLSKEMIDELEGLHDKPNESLVT